MRRFLAKALHSLANRLTKSAPSVLGGSQWSGTSYVDSFKRERAPTPNELLAELKNAAFTCASIKASVCASFPPRLYIASGHEPTRPPHFRLPERLRRGNPCPIPSTNDRQSPSAATTDYFWQIFGPGGHRYKRCFVGREYPARITYYMSPQEREQIPGGES